MVHVKYISTKRRKKKRERERDDQEPQCVMAGPKAAALKLERQQQHHSESLLKQSLLGLAPRVSDLVGVKGDLRICISSKCPGDVDAAGLRTTL